MPNFLTVIVVFLVIFLPKLLKSDPVSVNIDNSQQVIVETPSGSGSGLPPYSGNVYDEDAPGAVLEAIKADPGLSEQQFGRSNSKKITSEVNAILDDEMDTSQTSVLHACEFNKTTCGWEIYNSDDEHGAYFRTPPPDNLPPDAPLSIDEQQNLWRDFLYVNNTSLFLLTSPEFIMPTPDDDQMSGTRLHHLHGYVFCASFSAKTSQLTRAGLFVTVESRNSENASLGHQRLMWNVDASPDDTWTTYHLNVRLKTGSTSFRLQFVATKSVTETSCPDNEDNKRCQREGVYFAIGFILLQRGGCDQEVLTNDMQVVRKRVEGQDLMAKNSDKIDEARMVIVGTSALWPGGIIPYEIALGYFNSTQKSMIRTAMLDIANRSCIRFVPHLQSTGYAEILGDNLGCFSSVGYNGGYSYTNLDPSSCFDMRTIRHELLHLIGFYHEHQRPDRDKYIDILWDNVKEAAWDQFNLYDSDTVELLDMPYDYESVMHYGTKTFSKNGLQTIRAKNPWARIGVIQTFSTLDTFRLRKLYSCDSLETSAIWGGYCTVDIGSFKCQRYAPCELGVYACPSPLAYDPYRKACKTSRKLDESCTGTDDYCSVTNSECGSTTGICQCKTGYYKGPKSDCLVNSANKRLGDSCTDVFDCTYELICDSSTKVCRCPTYQTNVGNYGCENKKFGSTCSTNKECSQAVPAAWCINGVCQCPGAFYADTYIDEYGVTQQACAQRAIVKAKIGEECDISNGILCASGGICRTCPNALSDICTTPLDLGIVWNAFPDKPPNFYVISASTALIVSFHYYQIVIVNIIISIILLIV